VTVAAKTVQFTVDDTGRASTSDETKESGRREICEKDFFSKKSSEYA